MQSSPGIASVTRTSAGLYKITLQDKYSSLKHVSMMIVDDSAQDRNAQLKSEDVNGTKEIELFTLAAATPTDPADGAVLHIHITVKNTAVN